MTTSTKIDVRVVHTLRLERSRMRLPVLVCGQRTPGVRRGRAIDS